MLVKRLLVVVLMLLLVYMHYLVLLLVYVVSVMLQLDVEQDILLLMDVITFSSVTMHLEILLQEMETLQLDMKQDITSHLVIGMFP